MLFFAGLVSNSKCLKLKNWR